MYRTIESLAHELGVSTLVLQRRAVKLGVYTTEGIAQENVHKLKELKVAKVEKVKVVELATVPTAVVVEDTTLRWYGEFANGKPVYRRANEHPVSRGTVASTPIWEQDYIAPEYKEVIRRA